MNTKTIAISLEVYNYLKGNGMKGDSFDIILRRLLNFQIQTKPFQTNPVQTTPTQLTPDRAKSYQ